MTLHDKHIELVEAVNNSSTNRGHDLANAVLHGWMKGVEDCGFRIDLCAADMHYINQGIDRPMCCGVFLDWRASDE